MDSFKNLAITESTDTNNIKSNLLVVPYAGLISNRLIKFIQNNLKRLLPEIVTTRSAYTSTKLRIKLTSIKDQILQEHQHDSILC